MKKTVEINDSWTNYLDMATITGAAMIKVIKHPLRLKSIVDVEFIYSRKSHGLLKSDFDQGF